MATLQAEFVGVVRFLLQLERRGRIQIAVLFGLSLIGSLCEILGVSAVGPFVAIVSGGLMTRLEQWSNFGLSHQALVLVLGSFVWIALLMVQLIQLVVLRLGCNFADEQQRLTSQRLYHRYLSRPFSWLAQNGSHQFIESMAQARSIHLNLYRPLMGLAVSSMNSILLLLLLASLDPLVSILVILTLGSAFSILYFRCQAEVCRIANDELRLREDMMRGLSNVHLGLKPILLAKLSGRIVRDYESKLSELSRLTNRRTLLTELPRAAIFSISQAGLLIVVAWLYSRAPNPQEILPKLGVFIAAIFRLIPCVQASLGALLTLRSAGPLLDLLWDDLGGSAGSLTLSSSAVTQEGGLQSSLEVAKVVLAKVSYSYPGENSFSLSDCEFEVRKGERVAIVGRSGSGKSTLLHLLVGLLDGGGALEVNGRSLGSEQLADYQSLVGYVSQDNVVLNGDVFENITFLSEKPTVERLAVQKLASLVGLQQQLDFQVGPSGSQLSGGQRQRLGIAQALYRQPQVLVLDEATNAMDLVSESEIFEHLAASMSEMLLIVVTHRLQSLLNFDRIYVLVDGQIVGCGRYQELLSDCPAFKELCSATAETSQ